MLSRLGFVTVVLISGNLLIASGCSLPFTSSRAMVTQQGGAQGGGESRIPKGTEEQAQVNLHMALPSFSTDYKYIPLGSTSVESCEWRFLGGLIGGNESSSIIEPLNTMAKERRADIVVNPIFERRKKWNFLYLAYKQCTRVYAIPVKIDVADKKTTEKAPEKAAEKK